MQASSLLLVTAVIICMAFIFSCSLAHKVYTYGNAPLPDQRLVSKTEDEVKKQIGEPSKITRTPDNHILWIYQPEWKMMPDEKGTLYIEFVEGKAVKVFQLQ